MINRMRTWYLCTQVIQNVLEHGSVITGTVPTHIFRFLYIPYFRKNMRREITKISDTTNTAIVRNATEDAVCLG